MPGRAGVGFRSPLCCRADAPWLVLCRKQFLFWFLLAIYYFNRVLRAHNAPRLQFLRMSRRRHSVRCDIRQSPCWHACEQYATALHDLQNSRGPPSVFDFCPQASQPSRAIVLLDTSRLLPLVLRPRRGPGAGDALWHSIVCGCGNVASIFCGCLAGDGRT